jgi:hypothetical protein
MEGVAKIPEHRVKGKIFKKLERRVKVNGESIHIVLINMLSTSTPFNQ